MVGQPHHNAGIRILISLLPFSPTLLQKTQNGGAASSQSGDKNLNSLLPFSPTLLQKTQNGGAASSQCGDKNFNSLLPFPPTLLQKTQNGGAASCDFLIETTRFSSKPGRESGRARLWPCRTLRRRLCPACGQVPAETILPSALQAAARCVR
jgi:hypothetical protein